MVNGEQIRAAVKADNELRQLAFDGNDAELARRITVNETSEYRLTSAGILDQFGPMRGGEIMAKLRQFALERGRLNQAMAEVVRMMDGVGVDLSHRDASTVIDQLAPQIVTAEEAAAIKALPVTEVHPTPREVSKALKPWRPGGRSQQLVTGE